MLGVPPLGYVKVHATILNNSQVVVHFFTNAYQIKTGHSHFQNRPLGSETGQYLTSAVSPAAHKLFQGAESYQSVDARAARLI